MDTMIHRLFQHLYIILIFIMSIFNISLIYLIDVNDEDNMNDHDENAINESMDGYSETVIEIPLNPIFIVHHLQIADLIVHTNDQNYIRFGQTQICHLAEVLFYKIQNCKHYTARVELSSNKNLEIYDKLILIPLNDTDQDLIIKEKNVSFNINVIGDNKLDVVIDDTINNSVKNNKSNVKDIPKVNCVITIGNNLMCTLYDAFLYGFTPSFCWIDDIKNFTPAKAPDDIHSFYDSNEKNSMNIIKNSINIAEEADELLSCFKKFFIDILNDEQSHQKRLMNEYCISETASIDVLSDQILQDEENTIDENKVDHEELILPTYSMSMHFRKQWNSVCPNEE
ncbi:unnamed protein product [Rotaria sp. Silwood2]|nr:unnamed protein product [Rotaria sp. Silwood2]